LRLLADENMHPAVVTRLRHAGYQTEWIAETSYGATDASILQRPDIGSLILITFDRDFGDLIFNQKYPPPLSILYTRLSRAHPDQIAERLLAALDAGVPAGQMITLTKNGERTKPFPAGAHHG
jgi:predicted nuclease of predicted toxin-antitoxin system